MSTAPPAYAGPKEKLQPVTGSLQAMKAVLDGVVAQAGGIVLGKERQIRLALACLLARGHLLIEDLPGVGKTTLAHVLAGVLGLSQHRIQFTSDLLPADILGVSVYDRDSGGFKFHPGPIFAHLILADEINRATPKAQSALLDYLQALLAFSRRCTHYQIGLSPRAGLALRRCAQAWALLHGRDHVLPEDVQAILPSVVGHRLKATDETTGNRPQDVLAHLAGVPVP